MKVIGKADYVAKQVVCKQCGSIIEYYPNEIKTIKYGYDYLGGYEVGKGITCPACKNDIILR